MLSVEIIFSWVKVVKRVSYKRGLRPRQMYVVFETEIEHLFNFSKFLLT